MAKRLPEAERRRLAADFDPPAASEAYAHDAPPLTGGKRVRVTANLSPAQYGRLRRAAKRRGLSLSAAIGAAVEAFCEK